MFSASQLTVRIGTQAILNNVAMSAVPGEVTAIVGPNGSGKSTLLKALSGDVPYEGSVQLDQQDVAHIPPWRLATRRAVLPQASTLAFPFTVLEVVKIGLQASHTAADHSALEALRQVGLAGFADRFYQELSGGEQQRAQLARVLAQVPEPARGGRACWLLLDEPVSALDLAHQLEVMQIARRYAARGGGVITVMHDLNLTAMFADKVTMLKAGRVLASGSVTSVLTDQLLSQAYDCTLRMNTTPASDVPFLLPHAAGL